MAKAKKSKAKKSKAKKSSPARAKKAAKKSKAAAKGRGKKKKIVKAVRKAASKPAKKAVKKKPAKQTVGEGDYAASRSFLKDQADFVKRNQDKIPAMGKAAEQALEGPEGAALRAAEEEAKNHAKPAGN